MGRLLAYLREAEALAALDDPRRLAQVSVFLSFHFYLMGAYDQAIAAAQRALALATSAGRSILHARGEPLPRRAYRAQGDYRRAIDCLGADRGVPRRGAAPRALRPGSALPAVHSRAFLAVCHAELGTFAEGRAFGDEGLRHCRGGCHAASLMWASWGIGLLFLRQGNLPRALPLLERAVGICQEAERPAIFPVVAAALGAGVYPGLGASPTPCRC